jgi:hypothetical protein
MHERSHVSFLKIVPLDAALADLGIAKPQPFFSQAAHLLTPIEAFRRGFERGREYLEAFRKHAK